ncbi:MAG TPA: amidohydrolase family protein [Candidatus Lokiarchaeia archaeon]|nr:amidohydrolase family protein [Candidatus Lokiarchaeia archaeon]
MRIVDAHAHILQDPDYVEKLLTVMDECNIAKCCISGIGPLFHCVGNAEIQEIINDYPDRFIGAVFVRPGLDGPAAIQQAHDVGFRMVKVTLTRVPYDDPSAFPLWKIAQELGMPVLFHTGVVTTAIEAPGEGINSWWMHPMRVEPITREFPDLKIILAHLGIAWNDDAAELARMRPNVYVDLTGEPAGWRARADAVGMDKWLWWSGAWQKVVFGTDVTCSKIPQILADDIARCDRFNLDEETRECIFSRNILTLLGME